MELIYIKATLPPATFKSQNKMYKYKLQEENFTIHSFGRTGVVQMSYF